MWREPPAYALRAGFIVAAAAVLPGFAAGGTLAQQGSQTPNPAAAGLTAQALAYEHGEGVPKDARKAAELYCAAARDGDAEATFGLGWMYANGRGVEHDDAVAVALFARAAEAGHTQARKLLGVIGAERGELPSCMRERQADADVGVDPDAGWGLTEADIDPIADLPAAKQRIADLVTRVAPRFAVDPRLALAVIATESNFDPQARSPKDARGLMQLIPETAARFNVKNPFDVLDNVRGGLAYLRWLLAYYQGRVALVAAAYNAGERAVDRYGGVPPYPETRDYVQKVLRAFRRDKHPYDPGVVEPSPMLVVPAADRKR
jgi:hypothetical protein